MNKKHILWIAGAGFVVSLAIVLAVALPASAQTMQASVTGVGHGSGRGGHSWMPGSNGGMKMAPGVFGTVTAISGTTLTVTSKSFMRPNSTSTPSVATVYTVNAGSATVYKNGATSTLASVATGDTVVVQGTVTGTNVAATVIRDGVVPGPGGPGGMMGKPGMGGFGHGATSTFQGNGEPIVGGNISAISSTTLTITNASNVTYTVDASSAKIVKGGTTTTISALTTGDSVVVQGTVNGNSITASSVIDQATSTSHSTGGPGGGFFGAIGSFFKRIFGF